MAAIAPMGRSYKPIAAVAPIGHKAAPTLVFPSGSETADPHQ